MTRNSSVFVGSYQDSVRQRPNRLSIHRHDYFELFLLEGNGEHFNDFAEAHVKQAAPGNPEVHDGFFALPHGPGLGVTLNEDVIREHPLRDLHFHLFDQDWHLRQAREAGTP